MKFLELAKKLFKLANKAYIHKSFLGQSLKGSWVDYVKYVLYKLEVFVNLFMQSDSCEEFVETNN